ncbi:hypothetical protein [Georgenia alba]|uniref:ABC transporter permease n=1 Tax=Georgenia alba TaxID=2233858 RepID=A0ABW2Q8Y4_9MICO
MSTPEEPRRRPEDAAAATADEDTETVDVDPEDVEDDDVERDRQDETESYGVPELDDADEDDEDEDDDVEGTPSDTIARVLNLAVGLVVAVFIALLVIVAPNAGSTPRNVPIGMAGPEATVTQLSDLLEQARPGAYDVRTFDGAEALRSATESRDVYGGFVLNQNAPAMFVATGGNAEQAQFLSSLGQQMGISNVTDVATTTPQDPDALGLAVTAVLAAVVGLIAAVGLRQQLAGRVRAQAIGAVALSVVLGLAFSGALHGLGSVAGAFWALAGVVSLGVLAPTLLGVGLLGLAGLAGGAITLLLLVPAIGLGALWNVPEAMPSVWGTVGQYLPTGATGQVFTSTAYFGGGGLMQPLLVLLGWALLGALLVLGAGLYARRVAARSAALESALATEAALEDDDDERTDDEDDDEDAARDDKMPEDSAGATVEDMDATTDDDRQPGQSDWLRDGGAEDRPGSTEDEKTGDALTASQEVHGDEGGGDPAAGAEEDATDRPDGGHRSSRDV